MDPVRYQVVEPYGSDPVSSHATIAEAVEAAARLNASRKGATHLLAFVRQDPGLCCPTCKAPRAQAA
ncbi:MAG TPA: hypothetical protein VFT22_10960 [Kofleriaceae bacterium]|nr:hypothetical protein [Kofleriaceae bacterium]